VATTSSARVAAYDIVSLLRRPATVIRGSASTLPLFVDMLADRPAAWLTRCATICAAAPAFETYLRRR